MTPQFFTNHCPRLGLTAEPSEQVLQRSDDGLSKRRLSDTGGFAVTGTLSPAAAVIGGVRFVHVTNEGSTAFSAANKPGEQVRRCESPLPRIRFRRCGDGVSLTTGPAGNFGL